MLMFAILLDVGRHCCWRCCDGWRERREADRVGAAAGRRFYVGEAMRFLQGMACVRKVDRRIARGDVGQGPGEPLRFLYQGRADALGPPYVRASVSVSAKRTAGTEVTRYVCTGIWSNPMSNQAAWAPPILTIKPNPLAAAAELLDAGLGKRRMRVDATSTAPCRRVSSRRNLGALTQHSQRQHRRTRLQAPLCGLAVRSGPGPMLLGRGQPEVAGRCGSQPGCPVGRRAGYWRLWSGFAICAVWGDWV